MPLCRALRGLGSFRLLIPHLHIQKAPKGSSAQLPHILRFDALDTGPTPSDVGQTECWIIHHLLYPIHIGAKNIDIELVHLPSVNAYSLIKVACFGRLYAG